MVEYAAISDIYGSSFAAPAGQPTSFGKAGSEHQPQQQQQQLPQQPRPQCFQDLYLRPRGALLLEFFLDNWALCLLAIYILLDMFIDYKVSKYLTIRA